MNETGRVRRAAHPWPFELSKHVRSGRKGVAMTRQYVDCREIPSQMNCSVAIAADSERELMDAAVQHAVTVHGHADTPELRNMIASTIKKGTPPVEAPAQRHASAK
jgi:predicted small metal-binding protein